MKKKHKVRKRRKGKPAADAPFLPRNQRRKFTDGRHGHAEILR